MRKPKKSSSKRKAQRVSVPKRAATSTDRKGWLVEWAHGGPEGISSSGIPITNDKALKLAVVFACIRNISEDVAKLPLFIYRRLSEGREKLPKHNLHYLLNQKPNPEISAMAFRESQTGHILGWGNCYSEIQRDIYGRIVALWPLRPDRVKPLRDESDNLWYEVTNEKGTQAYLRPADVLHIPGFGYDGTIGYNVIHYARECISLGIATEKFGGKFFSNGANPSGVIEHPLTLSDKAHERLKASLQRDHGGIDKSNKTMILEEGMKYNRITIPPEEAQFLETRQFTIPDICRWFRMQPHKVGDLLRATFSNIEHQAIEYVTDTLDPWCRRWEQGIDTKLLTPQEIAEAMYVKHKVDALLRGDIRSRYGAYAIGRQWGWLSADDIRELEDMNPLPDGQGQKYLVPLNMVDAKQAGQVQRYNPDPNQNQNGKDNNNGDDVLNGMASDCAGRIYRAEIREVEKHIGKWKEDRARFNGWLSDFYEQHFIYIGKALVPLRDKMLSTREYDELLFELSKAHGQAMIEADNPENVFMIIKRFGGLYTENAIRKAMGI